jgi:hypothetical protein
MNWNNQIIKLDNASFEAIDRVIEFYHSEMYLPPIHASEIMRLQELQKGNKNGK